MEVYARSRRLALVKECTGFFSRARGLMFSRLLCKGEGILLSHSFESRWLTSLHMFFVFSPIDIVWLDSCYSIVDMRLNVKPFTPFLLPRKKARYVLELSCDTARSLSIGDTLNFRRKTI